MTNEDSGGLKQPSRVGLESDGIRRERCAFALPAEMRGQPLAMQFRFDPDLADDPLRQG